jgi:glucan 1,3-beta-glucosidase
MVQVSTASCKNNSSRCTANPTNYPFPVFSNNYIADTCVPPANCQASILNIDSASSNINILGLATVGVTNMLSVNGNAIISQANNRFGTQATVLRYTK